MRTFRTVLAALGLGGVLLGLGTPAFAFPDAESIFDGLVKQRAPQPAAPSRPASSVRSGTVLNRGAHFESPNGVVTLDFQASDGNLVLREKSARDGLAHVMWGSGSVGRGAQQVAVQADGNLVVYSIDHQVLWSSKSVDRYPVSYYNLMVQDDGNLVLYRADNTVAWKSDTTLGKCLCHRRR